MPVKIQREQLVIWIKTLLLLSGPIVLSLCTFHVADGLRGHATAGTLAEAFTCKAAAEIIRLHVRRHSDLLPAEYACNW